MINLRKVGLTALAGSLAAVTAHAGELSVTGSANLTYVTKSGDNTAQSFGNDKDVKFSGSGELDNGMNVSISFVLDQGDDSTAASAAYTGGPFDSHSVKVSSDTLGSLTLAGEGGSSAASSIDGTAAGDIWDTFDGARGAVTAVAVSDSGPGDNSLFYTLPSIMDGLDVNLSYQPQGSGRESATGMGVTYTGMEGLTIGYGTGDVEQTTGTKSDESTLFAKYAVGGATVGIQKSEQDNETASDVESTGIGISYAVNDDLTISYGSNTREKVGSDDQEAQAIGASYTVGSMGIAVSMHSVDNVNNTSSDDREGYQMVLTFAF